MQHLDEGTIHALLDGALDPAEAARAEAHAAECGECAAKVAEARGLIAGSSRIVAALDAMPLGGAGVVRAGRPGFAGSARSGRSRSLWGLLRATPARAAAAAVLIVAAGTVLTMQRTSEPRVSAGSPSHSPSPASAVTNESKERPMPVPGRPSIAGRGSALDSAAGRARSPSRALSIRPEAQPSAAAAPPPAANAAPLLADRLSAKAAGPPEPMAAAGVARQIGAAPMAAKRLDVRADSNRSKMLETAVATSADRAIAPRCFEIADSVPANIPTRFTLDTTRLGPNRRTHAVTTRGAGDAVAHVTNGYWIQTTPDVADVYWRADEKLRLQIPSSNDNVAVVGATLWQGERASSVQLRRCDR